VQHNHADTTEAWTDYAREMQDAGAAAIELNSYYLPGDPSIPGRDGEQRYVDVLQRVKDAVTVPVSVKLGPYFSSTGEIALRLDEAGADALVLFNRFLQPTIDPETLAVVPSVALSGPVDALLPQTWIALLRGKVRSALAGTSGVEDSADVARRQRAAACRRRCATAATRTLRVGYAARGPCSWSLAPSVMLAGGGWEVPGAAGGHLLIDLPRCRTVCCAESCRRSASAEDANA
jgi:dihydroorotate dehydrogenase